MADPAGADPADPLLTPAPDPAAGSVLAGRCVAAVLVPGRLRAKVRSWRERHHPESIEERHVRSAADRRVEFTPARDGMAWLSACLPAASAEAIHNRLTAISRGQQGPHETRTLPQRRADNLVEALLTAGLTPTQHKPTTSTAVTGPAATNVGAAGSNTGSDAVTGPQPPCGSRRVNAGSDCHGRSRRFHHQPGPPVPDQARIQARIPDQASGSGSGAPFTSARAWGDVPVPRAQVLITVPVMALLGATEEPAILDGYGPIPPSMARDLIANGAESFHRVLIDPRDGAPLEIGRKNYRLTPAMRHWLRLRDAKCTFPGCNNNTLDNDADHIHPWHHGGTTGINNLNQLCPKHHHLKHNTTWTPTTATKNHPPGWLSPTGRYYPAEHPDHEPPTWPSEWTQQHPTPEPAEPPQITANPEPPWAHTRQESERLASMQGGPDSIHQPIFEGATFEPMTFLPDFHEPDLVEQELLDRFRSGEDIYDYEVTEGGLLSSYLVSHGLPLP